MLSTSIDEIGWTVTVIIHGLILALLSWILIIRRLRETSDRRRIAMTAVWRPVLAQSLIEAPSTLPSIHPRDRILFLYLWNTFQESIKGDSSTELGTIIGRLKLGPVVRRFLTHGTMRQQLLALVTLGHLKDPLVWPTVVTLVHTENPFLSIEAARALVRIDAPKAIPVLVPLIATRTDWSPLKVLAILQGAGEPLVARALGEAAQHATPEIAARLIRYLASIRSQRALPFVRLLLNRQPLDHDVLASCLTLFGQCTDPQDLPIVRRHLTHPTWFIRVHAATALGKMGLEEDEPALISLLQDAHWWVRYRAAEALSVLPSMTDDKLSRLVQTLSSTDARKVLTPFVANRIEQALAHEPPAAAA